MTVKEGDITTLKGKITIEIEGEEFSCEIDSDDFVCVALMESFRNGKNPAAALMWLAEVGSKEMGVKGVRAVFKPQRKSFIGD